MFGFATPLRLGLLSVGSSSTLGTVVVVIRVGPKVTNSDDSAFRVAEKMVMAGNSGRYSFSNLLMSMNVEGANPSSESGLRDGVP